MLHLNVMVSIVEIDMGPSTEIICLCAVQGRFYAIFTTENNSSAPSKCLLLKPYICSLKLFFYEFYLA